MDNVLFFLGHGLIFTRTIQDSGFWLIQENMKSIIDYGASFLIAKDMM